MLSSLFNVQFISIKHGNDFSIGFNGEFNRKEEGMKKKTEKGKIRVRVYSKDVFGSAEHQESGKIGFRYELFFHEI